MRQLPSGLWQARARDGATLVSVGAFPSRREAERALGAARAAQDRAEWVRPRDGRITLTKWVDEWAETTADLRPRTREGYAWVLETLILPQLGGLPLVELTTPRVEAWLAELRRNPRWSPATVAMGYRLLRQILGSAVRARRITANPCTVRGAGQDPRPELRVPSLGEVLDIADAIDPRYRAIVLLAGTAGLRWGECAGLRWGKVDLLRGRVLVDTQLLELQSGKLIVGPPKSAAGTRWVTLPAIAAAALADHLDRSPGRPDDFVFRAPLGGPLRRSAWAKRAWRPACMSAGVEGVRFHDLRHCALTTAAQEGATIAELMALAGHSSLAASVRYQHATGERARLVANKVDEAVKRAR